MVKAIPLTKILLVLIQNIQSAIKRGLQSFLTETDNLTPRPNPFHNTPKQFQYYIPKEPLTLSNIFPYPYDIGFFYIQLISLTQGYALIIGESVFFDEF
jgi:hypothetical protein